MATHSSVLALRIQGRGSLVGCRLWGRTELDTTKATQQQQHPILPMISAKHFSNPFFFNAIATAWVKFLLQLGITIIPYGTVLPSLPSGSTFPFKTVTLNILVHKPFNEKKGENHAVLYHHLQDKIQIIPPK